MTDDPRVAFLRRCLDADEATAQAAEKRAASPWKGERGLVAHSGPIDRYERDDQLWDSEGCIAPHRLAMDEPVAAHVARHDPASVLALVEAHRAMLELHEPQDYIWEVCCSVCEDGYQTALRWPCPTMEILLSAYRGRDGWRDEWAEEK